MNDINQTVPRILYVDDEPSAVKYFERAIGELAPVITANSAAEGKRVLEEHGSTLRVLVSDQRMPGEDGNSLLRYARERHPQIVRILTTAYSELEQTVIAINEGQIHRYLRKPWDISMLRMELKQTLAFADLRRERDLLLQEKMMVGKKSIVANRIGALHAMFLMLRGPEFYPPFETYLSAALQTGPCLPDPDWVLMDHADLVAEDAHRIGVFGCALMKRLDSLPRLATSLKLSAAQALSAVIPLEVQAWVSVDGETILIHDETVLAELIEADCRQPVSTMQVAWTAMLLRLSDYGYVIECERRGDGLRGQVQKIGERHGGFTLAGWIERFE